MDIWDNWKYIKKWNLCGSKTWVHMNRGPIQISEMRILMGMAGYTGIESEIWTSEED